MGANRSPKLRVVFLPLVAFFLIATVQGTELSSGSSRYVFIPDQSVIVQTGGFAGVHWTYSIDGQFCLVVDAEAGSARFEQVDANAVDASEPLRTLDPNEAFNLTGLIGAALDDTTIEFTGKAANETEVRLTLTFEDDTVHLLGETIPPPNSADFFILNLDATARRKYNGGTGDPNTPYLISTPGQMNAIGAEPNDYDKHFKLMVDIDLSGYSYDRAVIAPDTDESYWGHDGTTFTGTFDGNGYTVSHLTITGGSYLGLFGKLNPGAKISNLGLEAVDVNGTDGHGFVGGIAGFNYGSIIASHSSGTVTGSSEVGGLAGMNWPEGDLTACFSTALVSGNLYTGGLVGCNVGQVSFCYSTGSVSGGEEKVGGLLGSQGGWAHGRMLEATGTATHCFWDVEKSGQIISAGGTGLSTAEMQDIGTFLREGWDFVDEAENGTCDYWWMPTNDYPRLRYRGGADPTMPGGMGTAEQPYLIRNVRDLGTVWLKPMGHFRLEVALDLSETTWSVAVVPWFGGTFDGNGHVISNLHIQGGGHLGLFGQLGSGAKISNLGLEAVDVNGTGDYVGGLAGLNNGNIAASYSRGIVSGDGSVGGLAGLNASTISTSYSAGEVNGADYYVGGLVGRNGLMYSHRYGSICGSYSTAEVDRSFGIPEPLTPTLGGLVGNTWVGDVTASFWDTQTSGQAESDGGTGRTTTEMQRAGTFLEAGWDFVGEVENGTDDIWWILEGRDYPRLWWEAGEEIKE